MLEYEILEKAAAIIEEKGHCTGRIYKEDGSVCAIGAIGLAQGYTVESMYDDDHENYTPWPVVVSPVPAFADKAKGRWVAYLSAQGDRYAKAAQDKLKNPSYDNADFVYRYNDDVCEGGEELVELLRETASELRASETR